MNIKDLQDKKQQLERELKEVNDQLSNIDGWWAGHDKNYIGRLIRIVDGAVMNTISHGTGCHVRLGSLEDYTLVTKLKDSDFGP